MPKTYSPEFVHEERAALVSKLETFGLFPDVAATVAGALLPELFEYADEWDSYCRECIITVAARKLLALRPTKRTPAP